MDEYRQFLVECVRYFDMTVLEAKKCTLADFDVLLEAKHLKDADELYKVHRSAWANMMVNQTKRNGRPRFPTFEKFFDYEKLITQIRTGEVVESKPKRNMARGNQKLSEFREIQKKKKRGGNGQWYKHKQ